MAEERPRVPLAPWAILPGRASPSRALGPSRSGANVSVAAPLDTRRFTPPTGIASTSADVAVRGANIDNHLNSNSNNNTVSGPANIVNTNSHLNVLSNSGSTVNYAVTNITAPAPISSDAIQTTITTALKGSHVPHAAYDAQLGKGCMDGTRVQVLSDVDDWILDLDAQQIFWLAGMMGTGKTAIAWTVCSRASANPRIVFGGSFFCSRSTGSVAQRDARCIVPTLAQLLARQSAKFSQGLANELARDPDILHKQVAVQVKQLLYTPLLVFRDSPAPVLFVIDALDECSGQSGPEQTHNDSESRRVVSEILGALVDFSRYPVKLPVKFLVTSRPETHIRDTPVSEATFSNILRLHTVNKKQVTLDIRLYISTRLSSSPKLRTRFTDADADMLARLCDGLFIVAATALEYGLGAGVDWAVNRFKTLLNSARDGLSIGAAAPLDRMYSLILMDAARAEHTDSDELQAMMQLLASLLSARMALSVSALADLLGMDADGVRARLSRLHAVVHVPEDDADPSLGTLHASFCDYVFARAPGNIRISASLGHDVLARGCLRVMSERLVFNVSQSRSSHERNSATRTESITLALEYACIQWIYHVAAAPIPSEFDTEIDLVFRDRFLFWLEVVSVLGQVWRAAAILFFAASTVLQVELSKFLRDANTFVTSSFDAIERSAAHIYLSALPFAAKNSLVYQTFVPLYTGLVSVEAIGIDHHGGRLIMTLTGHENAVNSVGYSPDGRLLASGSLDGTVRIWDTRTGEEASSPLRSVDGAVWSVAFAPGGTNLAVGTDSGTVCIWSFPADQRNLRSLCGHSDAVMSVSFAPDGTILASASVDRTVRLWRAETGHSITVISGHRYRVNTVAFSPDGAILASGSDDMTIRLWHVSTGEPATEPMFRHGSTFHSICFSPDGTKLAADTRNNIQLWDPQSGSIISTLRGHSSWIRSIKFSPDGQSLVSASADCSVRLWTVPQDTGEAPSAVLYGHKNSVLSACFSPDGMHIASASYDCTIRIWDANSCQQTDQPVQVRTGRISTVAVSPDGSIIVSGSEDCSSHVWDVHTGRPRLSPLLGHAGSVCSVTVSSNGQMIASGSADGTIRLWEAQMGSAIGDQLVGHEGVVNSVVFSPDGGYFASGSDDGTVRIWDAAARQISNFDSLLCGGYVDTVSFSPAGDILAAGDSTGRIHLWHVATRSPACAPLQANGSDVRSIGFSPDGRRIVSGSNDAFGRVWSLLTGTVLFILEGHTSWVRSVTFSPDGQLICSGSRDHTVRLWNADSGAPVATLHDYVDWVMSVAFTPDGHSVVSCSFDTTIRVWDVNAALSLASGRHSDPVAQLGSATFRDGWLVGQSGELLLWVPTEYREHLHVPPSTRRIDHRRISVTIGSSGWCCGESWTSCWVNYSANTMYRSM